MRIRHAIATFLALTYATTGASAQMLAGSEWEPVALSGEAFEPIAEIFVRFEQDGRFFGNDGCNTIRGQFVTNGDAILFGPAAATMMACPEEVMAQERAFVEALMAARQYTRDNTDLTLSDAQGEELMRLKQRDAD